MVKNAKGPGGHIATSTNEYTIRPFGLGRQRRAWLQWLRVVGDTERQVNTESPAERLAAMVARMPRQDGEPRTVRSIMRYRSKQAKPT